MIDLNQSKYNPKEKISRDVILSTYSSLDVFKYYISPDVVPYKLIKSPLREDNDPSFIIFKHYNGHYFFKDFGGATGDCIHFVSLLFEYYNYNLALNRIGIDFGLSDEYFCSLDYKSIGVAPKHYNDDYSKIKSTIQVTRIDWNEKLLSYWSKYNISQYTLEKYNVYPISWFFVNGIPYKSDLLSFVYYEFKDDIVTKKIYQPFSKKIKFLAEHDYSVIDGFSQLPKSEPLLLITKSRKDIMCIDQLTHIPVIGTQGETVLIKENVMNDLKSRFMNIVTIFDNDQTGINLKDKYKEIYNINGFVYDKQLKSKDTAELITNHQPKKAKSILIKNIRKVLNA